MRSVRAMMGRLFVASGRGVSVCGLHCCGYRVRNRLHRLHADYHSLMQGRLLAALVGAVVGLNSQVCEDNRCEEQLSSLSDHPALSMELWEHSGGGFRHVGGDSWVEEDGGLTQIQFREIERDVDRQVVVLRDDNRALDIHLAPSQSTMHFGGRRSVLFRGDWVYRKFHSSELQLERRDKLSWGSADDSSLRYQWASETVAPGTFVLHRVAGESAGSEWVKVDSDGSVSVLDSEVFGAEGWRSIDGSWQLSDRSNMPTIRDVAPEIQNPGKPIALVTLYTPNIAEYADVALVNQAHYAKKHGYTLYVYRDSLVEWNQSGGAWHSIVTWNKIRAVINHLHAHEYVMWIDSDAIFTDLDKPLQWIIDQAPEEGLLVCEDPKEWQLNTGVMIFKNLAWTHQMLDTLWSMPKVEHSSGAEQNQLIKLLAKVDPNREHWHLFPECTFNCHPDHFKDSTFIIHYMGMGTALKKREIGKFNAKFGLT